MPHLVLLGDSVFDNGAYTNGGPAVIQQILSRLPSDWRASLGAIDGSTTDDIASQLADLPADATHLVLSVGGNNALLRAEVLESPVVSSGEALLMLAGAVDGFRSSYRQVVDACLLRQLPLVVCTVYNGCFPEPTFQRRVSIALAAFNDAIVRVAVDKGLQVIDLRLVCTTDEDFANPIEPRSRAAKRSLRRWCARSRSRPHRGGAPRSRGFEDRQASRLTATPPTPHCPSPSAPVCSSGRSANRSPHPTTGSRADPGPHRRCATWR
jgi:hypothetical protein